MSHIMIGNLMTISNMPKENAARHYISAALIFPERSGEAYFYLYLITEKYIWLKNAFENRKVKKSVMCHDTNIQKNIEEIFSQHRKTSTSEVTNT